ncbi:acetyl-CoA C-acyltransferase, partial [Salmonella enterica subsp. enterica serovar Enteritidis]|nr:acetyl-CoA C-acyltransferase [Salmonella enterica subsp. enterica serovar Enteritidis]
YIPMIETAEIVAERYGISREAQDAFAAASQQRAAAGLENGAFAEEIAPITVAKALFDKEGNRTGSETVTVTRDEGIRAGPTAEVLATLKPVWKDGQFVAQGRHVTAGNASQLSDGAAAQILMDRETAKAEG